MFFSACFTETRIANVIGGGGRLRSSCSVALTVFAIRLTHYRHVITKETNYLILTLMMGFVFVFVWIGASFRR